MRQLSFAILVLMSILFSYSCSKSSTNEAESYIPDTTNLLKLSNFLTEAERNKIISGNSILKNGKPRYKGIAAIPQNGDDFRGIDLDEVYWRGASVVEGDFRGVSFRTANCAESDFSDSDFRVSDIRWTNFDNSKLMNCDFTQAKLFHVHINNSDLRNGNFRGANMFGMDGHNAIFRNCDFSHAFLKDTEFLSADFTGSKAVKSRYIRAVLMNATLDSCDFSFSDFTGAGLEAASFRYSNLIEVNFQGSHLQGADFTGADLKGCNFFAAELETTIFTDAKNIPEAIQNMLVDGVATGVCSEGNNKH